MPVFLHDLSPVSSIVTQLTALKAQKPFEDMTVSTIHSPYSVYIHVLMRDQTEERKMYTVIMWYQRVWNCRRYYFGLVRPQSVQYSTMYCIIQGFQYNYYYIHACTCPLLLSTD